jgi:hypothetical protein
MKFKTAKLIQEIKGKTDYEFIYDDEKPKPQLMKYLMSSEEFERAIILAYDAGIQAGKKNSNEGV